MENISKFKWITIGCIAIFLFLVAAFYSNAKDISAQKAKDQQETVQIKNSKPQVLNNQDAENMLALRRVENMQIQIDELNARIERLSANSSGIRCNIQGIIRKGRLEQLPPEEAVRAVRNSDNGLALICKF